MREWENELGLMDIFVFLAVKRVSWITGRDLGRLIDNVLEKLPDLRVDFSRNNAIYHVELLPWLSYREDKDGTEGFVIDFRQVDAGVYDAVIRDFYRLHRDLHITLMEEFDKMAEDKSVSFNSARADEAECRSQIETLLKKHGLKILGEYTVCKR